MSGNQVNMTVGAQFSDHVRTVGGNAEVRSTWMMVITSGDGARSGDKNI